MFTQHFQIKIIILDILAAVFQNVQVHKWCKGKKKEARKLQGKAA